jgi:hypothetical protein
MSSSWTIHSVQGLTDSGVLLVEDGNHGEYRPLAHEFVKVGTPFVRPDDLKDGRVSFRACDCINAQATARVRKGHGQAGDTLFTHRATVGRMAFVGAGAPDFVANPGVTIWRSLQTKKLNPRFLYYRLHAKDFLDQVWSVAGSTDTFPYVRVLGQTNFVHFWEDNPELDSEARARQAAENCLVLTCLAAMNGAYELIDELYEMQTKLVPTGEQISIATMREVVDRLRRRGVVMPVGHGGGARVEPPIFRDWLNEYAEILLLRIWREFCARPTGQPESGTPRIEAAEPAGFPIPEDDLLAVSQRLVYLGKQKDVAEVRAWLRQFDDDARIEVAFLLLRRLAEKGYVTEGERMLAMQRVEEILKAPAEKPVVWRIVRGRHENLCVSYVDSETKSGASTARDVAKMLRPGKCAALTDVGSWLQSHLDQEAVLTIVDDFAGSGETLFKGLSRFAQKSADGAAFRNFCESGRVHLVLLFAFPEALQMLRKHFPKIKVTAIRIWGDEVRALEPESGIFSDEGERRFAQDILRQIGQQLVPQQPIGHGNLGGLVLFHNTVPNNTLPIFWSNGVVNERPWRPLFPRASWT